MFYSFDGGRRRTGSLNPEAAPDAAGLADLDLAVSADGGGGGAGAGGSLLELAHQFLHADFRFRFCHFRRKQIIASFIQYRQLQATTVLPVARCTSGSTSGLTSGSGLDTGV